MDRATAVIRRVDARDRPIGFVARKRVLAMGANFRVVHVLVVNRHGEVLLQQLPRTHERHPGWWGSSVAGYVGRDETYRDAARRKLEQELGVLESPRFLGKTKMHDGRSQKFVGVFRIEWDGPLAPNPANFGALCFVPMDRVEGWGKEREMCLTPTLLHVLGFLREHSRERS